MTNENKCKAALAAANPATPEMHLKSYLLSPVFDIAKYALRNPSITKWMLEYASRNQNPLIRVAVIRHPLTPKHVLIDLTCDPNPHVRSAIAESEKLDVSTILALLLDKNVDVRYSALMNNNLPQSIRLMWVEANPDDLASIYYSRFPVLDDTYDIP